ncbi:hypothetical protein SETIT_3G321000v2 [Setaria italica]|uniref:Ubiquitin-like protease family profile domain-containing protein n=1 Tax=Setaria italica TaxID=4555 RepID=K3ZBW7_SETIT|nr:hypothetical protein SETIT_3G321000v2 [Setaria italica]
MRIRKKPPSTCSSQMGLLSPNAQYIYISSISIHICCYDYSVGFIRISSQFLLPWKQVETVTSHANIVSCLQGSGSSVGIVPDEEKQENTLDFVAPDGNYIVADEEKHETILDVREIETLDDDVVPCGDDTVDAKDIITRENLEATIRVDASDAIATNHEIKAEDNVLESEDGNNLLDLINSIDALENPVDMELEDPKVSRHNKPKKVHEREVQPQDESIIKSIGGCREEHVVVRVDDIFVNYKTFKCLLRCNAYVNGDVSTLYICIYIAGYKHLHKPNQGYLENTLIVVLLQRDGKNKEKMKPNIKEDSIVERVMKYVAHDLVFLPINIEEMHWYLAVVNRKRREIQVLDSLGPMSCDDLCHVSDMTNFRLKLAAILCDSTLNTAKELPDDGITDDHTFDTTKFVFENLTQLSQLNPYPISLSLKNLQDTLDVNRSMDIDVFNLAVRMLACDMSTVLREPKSHFMDLMFSYICDYRRHPRNCVKHDPKSLAKFFDDWPRSGVSFSECRLVVVPYYVCESFDIFAFDKHARMIAIIYPSPIHHNLAYNHPSYYYLPRIQKIARTYDRAMDEIDPSWNGDIYDWNHIFPCLVPKTFDRCLTWFLVIELMNMWDGERIHGLLNVDSRLLRKWLLIEVLKCNFNESTDNIPEDVRVAV